MRCSSGGCGCLRGGVDGLGSNTAHVLVADNAEIAAFTPGTAPRVLDDPVRGAVLRASADSQNTVVKLGAARGIIDDTRGVELEDLLVSLNSDGDGVLLDGSEESILIVLGDIVEASDRDDGLAGGLADAGLGSVGIVGFSADTAVGLHELEGVVHQTTVTAHVALGARAVNQLLFGNGNEGSGLDGVGTLDRTSGRKGPA